MNKFKNLFKTKPKGFQIERDGYGDIIINVTNKLSKNDKIEIINIQKENKNKAPIKIKIKESLLLHDIKFLIKNNYKNWSYRSGGLCEYYLWNYDNIPDKINQLGNCRTNVHVLLFSPDEQQILVVNEKFYDEKFYKLVSGIIDKNYSIYDTIKKEIKEEVGLEIDENFEYVLCGVAEGKSEDILRLSLCYAAKVKEMKTFILEEFEINKAKWISIDKINQYDDIDRNIKKWLNNYENNKI